MEKIAVIDLGTNTFHLLIAERNGQDVKVLLKEKSSVKIGQGGITKGFITGEAYERAINALKLFKERIDEFGVKRVIATGTSAIRNARNGMHLVKDIKEQTGIEVLVISGEREAELIYYGVRTAVDMGKSVSLVIDIGGGSVEFILCNAATIFWKCSLEIGAQRLLDTFQPKDPVSTDEIINVINYLEEKMAPLFEATQQWKPSALIGASGSFDTFADIDLHRKGLEGTMEEETEYPLSFEAFKSILEELTHKTREERLAIPGMLEMRVDMIVLSSLLIDLCIRKIPFQKMRVSAYALKEGLLYKVLRGEKIEVE